MKRSALLSILALASSIAFSGPIEDRMRINMDSLPPEPIAVQGKLRQLPVPPSSALYEMLYLREDRGNFSVMGGSSSLEASLYNIISLYQMPDDKIELLKKASLCEGREWDMLVVYPVRPSNARLGLKRECAGNCQVTYEEFETASGRRNAVGLSEVFALPAKACSLLFETLKATDKRKSSNIN
ncbi:MAG: hypothetical protein EOP06_04410 [Proteobacteria bacterium]|nr:MAG: hypothetical protein EOP06_04410 [Pseudomonadota bacterium]